MVRLRRIPAVRAANVLTLAIAIPYGFVLLVFVLFFGVFWVTSTASSTATFVGLATMSGALVAWAAAILSVWISIAIFCAFYNLIAGRVGGLELEFETIPPSL